MTSASDVEGADPPAPTSVPGGSGRDDRPSGRTVGPTRRPSLFVAALDQAVFLAERAGGAVWPRVQQARWLATAGAVLFVVALPLALISTNIRVLFTSRPLYTFALDSYDVPTVTGIPRSELNRSMEDIRDYFTNDQQLLRITVIDDHGRAGPLFTPREVIHMRDVKHLVQDIFRLQVVALAVLAGYVALRFAIERGRAWTGLARLTRVSMLGTLAVAAAFAVSTFTGFDRLFTRFHELAFSNDFWLLDPARDRLVQMFPQDFWLVSTVILAGLTIVQVLALLALSWAFLQRKATAATRAKPPRSPRTPRAAKERIRAER
jgi:integral membrane protein (TIGR01906 family)